MYKKCFYCKPLRSKCLTHIRHRLLLYFKGISAKKIVLKCAQQRSNSIRVMENSGLSLVARFFLLQRRADAAVQYRNTCIKALFHLLRQQFAAAAQSKYQLLLKCSHFTNIREMSTRAHSQIEVHGRVRPAKGHTL